MMRSHVLKAGLLIVLVSLCVVVPIVILLRQTSSPETENTEDDETVSWTSPTTAELYSVYMVSPDDGWAVGYSSEGVGKIIRWNGTSWNNVTSPLTYWNSRLFSAYMVSPDDGWTVGGWGTIQRWTGTEWIPEFSAATLMLILISLTLAAVIIEKATLKK